MAAISTSSLLAGLFGTQVAMPAVSEGIKFVSDPSGKKRKEQEDLEARAKAESDERIATEKDRIATEQANENAIFARQASRRKQKQSALNQGRGGTILTSPLGIPQGYQGGGKTILGG